ncbi:hypothetical protein KGF56_003292 [Candida oxycetoniae]|uniref:Cyclin-like domain-containing protein n=1 Tax=Candida oxycetoniae TaxID=497107 RepID=A0AAI9WX47_9ASCO|nr:uncharacterized protein KGF56_003292 [Candida oxycetoniae]KAI3403862.2 hypothetical protein KGF56_003292 [Candida oxycetoniae]
MAERSSRDGERRPKKKQRITGDDLYRRSTQYEVWSFTPEQLSQAKARSNEKGRALAKARFLEAFHTAKSTNPEVFENHPQDLNESIMNLLTTEEESTYLDFYIQNITTTCNFFKMPTQVKLTAASFFKKFYLVNSVMEYHPKNVLYTCIFLAAKSENYFISIDSFVKALKGVQAADILNLEFILLQSLKFTLLVHHPIRPLYGFFLDFQAELLHPAPIMYDVSVDTIGNLYNSAREWLNKYYMSSNVAFLFAPPHIALAAIADTKKTIVKEDPKAANANRDAKKQPSGREQYESLVRSIRKCIKLAKDMPAADREKSKEIDKKCFFALNPRKMIDKRIKKLTAEKS